MQQASHGIAYKNRATALNLRADALIQDYCVTLVTRESAAPADDARSIHIQLKELLP
jgi:hypothetical protein